MKTLNALYLSFRKLLASPKFFVFTLVLFVLESTWIALSGAYPMAFDENFHLGIIRLYAHQWSPFFAHQPASADQYGAITRDPSYLYHYLMGFIDRAVTHLSHSQTVEILVLRFIDIALFTWGLVLLRKLLLKTKAPITWIHVTLFYFILIPIVPFLAAQINYDNLLIPLTALCLLVTISLVQVWRHGSKTHLPQLLGLLMLLLLTSLVKFTFLPFLLVIVIYLTYELYKHFKRQQKSYFLGLWAELKALKPLTLVVLLIPLLFCVGLFLERDGYNLVKYGIPSPQCDKVLGIQPCMAYGPWDRNYVYHLTKQNTDTNPAVFMADWLYGMFERSYFAVNGPETNYTTAHPLPILVVSSLVISCWGTLLALYYRHYLLKTYPYLKFLLISSFAYIVVLWFQNYADFRNLGQTVAINGRYLFPALLPLLLTVVLAYRKWMKAWALWAKGGLIIVSFLLFLQGAGALTFIIRSDNTWEWPHNRAVLDVNEWARNGLRYVILR